jgi:glycosyltransferase involved in cell wall biosynthesis
MKILLVTEFLDLKNSGFTGGVEARAYYLTKYLKKKHQAKIISRGHQGIVSANFFSIFQRLFFILQAIKQGIAIDFDIIEGSNFITYLPAWIISFIKRKPRIAWFADVYQKTWFKYYSFPVALAGWFLEIIALKLPWSQIIAMSQSTKKKLIKAGISSRKITVIYGGVDYKEYQSYQKTKKFPRPTICCLARLVNYKRVNDLIQAIHLIKSKIPQVQCLILGSGPEKNQLQSQIKSLKLSKNIRLLGSTTHQKAIKILFKSHLSSLPSVIEGFGLVTIESMAVGTPYVSSDIPPTREITQNGQGGFLFKPKNPRDLADKILKLLKDKKLYSQKRQQGIKLAQKYDWKKITTQTINAYRRIASI